MMKLTKVSALLFSFVASSVFTSCGSVVSLATYNGPYHFSKAATSAPFEFLKISGASYEVTSSDLLVSMVLNAIPDSSLFSSATLGTNESGIAYRVDLDTDLDGKDDYALEARYYHFATNPPITGDFSNFAQVIIWRRNPDNSETNQVSPASSKDVKVYFEGNTLYFSAPTRFAPALANLPKQGVLDFQAQYSVGSQVDTYTMKP